MESSENSRLIECLRREQANATQLYLQYKGYHWNVAGPLFHDLHLLFDDHARAVLETVDPLAERQRMLGAPAEYTLETLSRHAVVGSDLHVPASPREMVERLLDSHQLVVRGLKTAVELAMRLGDPGSADLLTRTVVVHEKMEWFLREVLEARPSALEGAAFGGALDRRIEGVALMGA